ncbi:MAG: hypothetical protein SFW35_00740 [Chitinophagales bacterium]|nr:hypothetical protein [Chitinophagales bacterium]
MRTRKFYYIHDEQYVKADDTATGLTRDTFTFKMDEVIVPTEDQFDESLVLLVFPIGTLFHIDSVLRMFNLKDDVFYFFQQCKDVIAVPEEHQDDKGNGKMNFQSFFHNVPYSMYAGNPNALVIVALDPEEEGGEGPRHYHLGGYMHLNRFKFQPDPLTGDLEPAFYFNMLRISQRMQDGQEVYRRKKLFSLFFSISHRLCEHAGINYIYASMGNENVKIKEALHRCGEVFGVPYERLPFKIFGKVNYFSESKSASKHLIDITQDKEMLKKYYDRLVESSANFIFWPYQTFDLFMDMVQKVTSYSKSSRIWMVKDEQGGIGAATFAMNWGDFFAFLMQNPKGIFKLLAALKLTEKILYFKLTIGKPEYYKTLQKGLLYHYRHHHGVKLSFLPSYTGDPYYKYKKSLLADEYVFFVMTHKPERWQHFKELSTDANGHLQVFIDQPIV